MNKQTKTIETLFPDTDWANLNLKTEGITSYLLSVFSKDKDDEVEINYEEGNENFTIYLNQEQVKALIDFLRNK